MAFLEQPPLPPSALRMVWLARAVSAVGLVIGVYVGALAAAEGELLHAFLILALALAYVLVTWANPHSPLVWLAIGTMVLILVVLDPGVISITVAIAASVFFWMRGRFGRSPSMASLRPVFTDTVTRGAEVYVGELSELGWRHVGGYAFDLARIPITAVVLVHPNLDRYSVITDMVFSIESRFPDSRFLVTLNSGRSGLPPNYLANDITGASPGALADAHQQALDVLATRGVTPMELDEEAIVEEALASEVETAEWSRANPSRGLFNFGGGAGVLDDSSVSAQRVETWLRFEAASQ